MDAVRYYISIAGPETSDADFTWAEFVRHNNEELAASWGNLVNRVANLINKNFGEIPALDEDSMTNEDRALLKETSDAFDEIGALIEKHHQKNALVAAMRVVGDINKYISAEEPWKIKDDELVWARCCMWQRRRCTTRTTFWHRSCRTRRRRSTRRWAAQVYSRRCRALKRSKTSTSRASRTRSSPATTSSVRPCTRGRASVWWPALRCRSRIRFAKIPPEAVAEELTRFDTELAARKKPRLSGSPRPKPNSSSEI